MAVSAFPGKPPYRERAECSLLTQAQWELDYARVEYRVDRECGLVDQDVERHEQASPAARTDLSAGQRGNDKCECLRNGNGIGVYRRKHRTEREQAQTQQSQAAHPDAGRPPYDGVDEHARNVHDVPPKEMEDSQYPEQ